MNKRQSKRQRDIKTKLMAAICMLLVSSIMMVSTTYAWFTLSTAPEVTGINTAVGSNGNLEMALLPLHGDASKITSGKGDSMAVLPVKESNITWGNLVKLDGTGELGYGLEQMTLYPSELNKQTVATDDGDVEQITMAAPLKTPEYGADGRVAKLAENTSVGVYANGGFYNTAFGKLADGTEGTINTPYGVRGIGTVSGMSPRNLAYNLALSSASTQALQAKSTASVTLNQNGSTLANVAIARVTDEGATYTQAQVDAMANVLNDLLGKTLVHIETALRQYIVASSIAPTTADSNYEELTTAIMGATLADLADGKVTGAVVSDAMKGYIADLTAMRGEVEAAKAGLPSGKTAYTWGEISTPMGKLINTDNLTVNGYPASEVKEKIGEIASSAMSGGGINVNLPTGSGIFSDIADFAGNYGAEISLTDITYNTTVMPGPFPAKMNTQGISPTYLEEAAAAVADYDDAGSGAGANPITDFYGFVIDLAFRTNAANSWLQIQTTAVDRIYTDGTNTNTMGHGATMTFEITDNVNFPGESVKRLMGAIRIVMFDPSENNQIITYARLDTAQADTATEAGKVIMPLMLCDKDGNPKTDDGGTDDCDESIGILQMVQNQIHQVSVLVYLDGNEVGNDDVPVLGNMTGSMNLQFSSSATLAPMQYADLKSGDAGWGDGNTPATPSAINLSPTVNAGDTGVTVANAKYADGKIAFTLTGWTDQTVTIKVGDAEPVEVTPSTVEGVTGVVYTVADVTADTAIVITITA